MFSRRFARSLVLSRARLLGLVLVVACKRPSPNPAPTLAAATASAAAVAERAAPVALPRDLTDRHVTSAGAFDLVTTEGGAALLWARAGDSGMSLTLLDQMGAERRTEAAFVESGTTAAAPGANITEVAAVARKGELGIVWLEQAGKRARSRGIVRPITDSGSASSVIEIGEVLTPASTPRGNVAITSSRDRFLVLSRGQKSECIEPTEHDCVGFDFHRLDATRAVAQNLPLSVPLPCDQNSVSFAVAGSRWYYGVCSRRTGKPVTTLFSIQTDPEYARADNILEGCLPLGALAEGGDLLVVGDCGGERRALRLRGGNAETSELRVDRVDAVCDAGYPLLHQRGANGLRLQLNEARDRLEAFLPATLTSNSSRAVWTGQTLLVAALNAGSITLKGYRCDSTLLREVSLSGKAR